MKIAILAYHFKPDEAVGSIRPENWADWLSQEHEVCVITREAKNYQNNNANTYKVVRPKSLAIRLLEALNDYRKNKRLLSQIAIRNRKTITEPVVSIANSGVFVYRMPCFYDLWFLSAFKALKKENPDLVIATHSPYISIIIAYYYCRLYKKAKLWLDFRDLWSTNHLATGFPFFSWVEKKIENLALLKANMISTVSEGLRKELSLLSDGKKTELIYNCPAKMNIQPSIKKLDDKIITFCYTGTIYSGWRDPTPLFIMLGHLAKNRKIIPANVRFCVASKNPGNLIELAKKFQVLEFIDFKGSLSRKDAILLQASSDILVLMETSAPSAVGILTGKVFEYLSTEKPILLIGPGKDSELYTLINKHNRLISLEEAQQILEGCLAMPTYQAVNYSDLSRKQVLNAIRSLALPC